MADERYAWLDQDAADRLLRGEPVDPVGDQAREEAERLAAALSAVAPTGRGAKGSGDVGVRGGSGAPGGVGGAAVVGRSSGPTGSGGSAGSAGSGGSGGSAGSGGSVGSVGSVGELPGEAAALAAFREARSGARVPDLSDGFGPVRIGGAPRSGFSAGPSASTPLRPRAPRRGRPVSFGLVASLAGCALGGVVVVAGAGLLSVPFGGHWGPAPATSVSAAASPEALGPTLPDGGGPSAPPPFTVPGTGAFPDASRSSGAPTVGRGAGDHPVPGGVTAEPDQGREGQDRAGDRGKDGSPDSAGREGIERDGTDRPEPDDLAKGRSDGERFTGTRRACRAYREGSLDERDRHRLEALARGAGKVGRFCDRALDGRGDRDGPGGSGGGHGHGGQGGSHGPPAGHGGSRGSEGSKESERSQESEGANRTSGSNGSQSDSGGGRSGTGGSGTGARGGGSTGGGGTGSGDSAAPPSPGTTSGPVPTIPSDVS
ncbi:hypothetical protein ACPXCE_06375 [Streptomyces sp. DT24]|uniref:hypothetical protein n=1 Tax=Streptomyces sp. DT24 TaxID=3416520 RepID=UPI003CFAD403